MDPFRLRKVDIRQVSVWKLQISTESVIRPSRSSHDSEPDCTKGCEEITDSTKSLTTTSYPSQLAHLGASNHQAWVLDMIKNRPPLI